MKAAARPVHVIQGEQRTSADPEVVMTTVLGSCISACLRDPLGRVGGMNHFLLPGDDLHAPESTRFGAYAMERLINDLLGQGADRRRLEAKLFGGSQMNRILADIGSANVRFATAYLAREGIPVTGGSTGGTRGRRIQFWPESGRARQVFLDPGAVPPPSKSTWNLSAPVGEVELF